MAQPTNHEFIEMGEEWRCNRCQARRNKNNAVQRCPVPSFCNLVLDRWNGFLSRSLRNWKLRWGKQESGVSEDTNTKDESDQLKLVSKWGDHKIVEVDGFMACSRCGKFSTSRVAGSSR